MSYKYNKIWFPKKPPILNLIYILSFNVNIYYKKTLINYLFCCFKAVKSFVLDTEIISWERQNFFLFLWMQSENILSHQNFKKLCRELGHNVKICILAGNSSSIIFWKCLHFWNYKKKLKCAYLLEVLMRWIFLFCIVIELFLF